MRLSEALKEKLLDIRLRDKLLADGKITKAQMDQFLKNLPDETDNATYTEKDSEGRVQKS